MLIDGFMRTSRPRRFNYIPRYYDPRKEALEELVDRVKAEDEGKIPTRHQLKFERKYGVHDLNRKSNMRIALIIVVMVMILLIMFM